MLQVLRFPDTGRFKGIVFITFADDEGYRNALDCNGSELDGQVLKACLLATISMQVSQLYQPAWAPSVDARDAEC